MDYLYLYDKRFDNHGYKDAVCFLCGEGISIQPLLDDVLERSHWVASQ